MPPVRVLIKRKFKRRAASAKTKALSVEETLFAAIGNRNDGSVYPYHLLSIITAFLAPWIWDEQEIPFSSELPGCLHIPYQSVPVPVLDQSGDATADASILFAVYDCPHLFTTSITGVVKQLEFSAPDAISGVQMDPVRPHSYYLTAASTLYRFDSSSGAVEQLAPRCGSGTHALS